jgi:hypothetical protein
VVLDALSPGDATIRGVSDPPEDGANHSRLSDPGITAAAETGGRNLYPRRCSVSMNLGRRASSPSA